MKDQSFPIYVDPDAAAKREANEAREAARRMARFRIATVIANFPAGSTVEFLFGDYRAVVVTPSLMQRRAGKVLIKKSDWFLTAYYADHSLADGSYESGLASLGAVIDLAWDGIRQKFTGGFIEISHNDPVAQFVSTRLEPLVRVEYTDSIPQEWSKDTPGNTSSVGVVVIPINDSTYIWLKRGWTGSRDEAETRVYAVDITKAAAEAAHRAAEYAAEAADTDAWANWAKTARDAAN